jgi:hypothetical protein
MACPDLVQQQNQAAYTLDGYATENSSFRPITSPPELAVARVLY